MSENANAEMSMYRTALFNGKNINAQSSFKI